MTSTPEPRPVGTVAEEAALLADLLAARQKRMAPVQRPGSDHAGRQSDAPGDGTSDGTADGTTDEPSGAGRRHGADESAREPGARRVGECTCGGRAPACRICPLCQVISFVSQVSPETIDRLAEVVDLAAIALRDLATAQRDQRDQPDQPDQPDQQRHEADDPSEQRG